MEALEKDWVYETRIGLSLFMARLCSDPDVPIQKPLQVTPEILKGIATNKQAEIALDWIDDSREAGVFYYEKEGLLHEDPKHSLSIKKKEKRLFKKK